MNYLIHVTFLLILLSNSLMSCGNAENIINQKANTKEISPQNWEVAFQKTTSFKEETQLLKSLIQIDSTNTYEQLIANRLQTFDLRHLKEAEKLAILDLYELSLQPVKQPSNTFLQIAYAKLNATYPTNNQSADKKITKIISLIKEIAGTDLEF